MDLQLLIEDFFEYVNQKKIEIYNEFALQFELAIFLRTKINEKLEVQLERNISFLGLSKDKFLKREIDILIFKDPTVLQDVYALELKAIVNQKIARPRNVFSWIEDLRFLEQLKAAGVGQCSSIFVTDNKKLMQIPEGKNEPKLRMLPDFRKKKVEGTYNTHKNDSVKNKTVTLEREYTFDWVDYNNHQKYFSIPVV